MQADSRTMSTKIAKYPYRTISFVTKSVKRASTGSTIGWGTFERSIRRGNIGVRGRVEGAVRPALPPVMVLVAPDRGGTVGAGSLV